MLLRRMTAWFVELYCHNFDPSLIDVWQWFLHKYSDVDSFWLKLKLKSPAPSNAMHKRCNWNLLSILFWVLYSVVDYTVKLQEHFKCNLSHNQLMVAYKSANSAEEFRRFQAQLIFISTFICRNIDWNFLPSRIMLQRRRLIDLHH